MGRGCFCFTCLHPSPSLVERGRSGLIGQWYSDELGWVLSLLFFMIKDILY
uniref:Uncharacterized protein n=1 Tax=Arundo donax TaxID=35708 RepID=A0A0A9BQX8_ARUDO